MSNKDKKDKDEKKDEKDAEIRESRRARDKARARVLETAERAGRHVNVAGGEPTIGLRASGWDAAEKSKEEKDAEKKALDTADAIREELDEIHDKISGSSRSVNLRRRRPADLARRFIESLSMDERREILNQLTDQLTVKKGWRHPIGAVVFTRYHRCTACNGKLGDEVVVVMHRRRTGDHMNVFCNTTCLMNYDGWL